MNKKIQQQLTEARRILDEIDKEALGVAGLQAALASRVAKIGQEIKSVKSILD